MPWKFFYVMTFYGQDGADADVPYFRAVAKRLAALPPLS